MVTVKVGFQGPSGQHLITCTSVGGYNRTLYLASDATNCKLSYIHGAGQLAGYSEEDLKTVFDQILNSAKGCVILNTINKTISDFINKTYPVYYYNEVPIGYGTGFQYHICFQNVIKVNTSCRQPVKLEVKNPLDEKAAIKQKLHDLLKSKRRKTDYVDEFINSL